MLDDLKFIHSRDKSDALGIAEKSWQQLQQNFPISKTQFKGIENVVVAGMGGSALAASICSSWPQLKVPFTVVHNYELPQYVGTNTLFIASSYSGNTEETLAALSEAENQSCQIAVVSSGGALKDRAEEKNYPIFILPNDLQPRMAVFYNLAALIQLLELSGLVQSEKTKELASAANWLKDQVAVWRPDVPTKDNQAKQIALELAGKSAVIYSGPKLFPAAYKWKININENAKNVAWCNQYPEFNHNEMLGWTSHPVDKPYSVIELRSNLEHPRIKKRFEVTEKLLSGRRPAPHIINAEGDTILKQLLWMITLGDFVSLYLALLNGLDPTPVDLIEDFKDKLK